MKFSILLFAFAALQSCGKSDNEAAAGTAAIVSSAPDGSPASVSQSGNSYSMTQQIQGSENYYFVNYRFKDGSCDTDLHRFSGPARVIVRSQLCAGLVNESMNHGCALSLRQQYFAQMCN